MRKFRFNFILIVLSLFFVDELLSQDTRIIDNNVNPGLVLDEMPTPPSKLEGSVYIHDDWRLGSIRFKSGVVISDVLLRFDLSTSNLELKNEKYVKAYQLLYLNEFSWLESNGEITVFKNANNFDGGMVGVFEMIYVSQTFQIGIKRYIDIKVPDYVPALNVGNKNRVVSKKEDYYLIGKKGVVEFVRTKPSILKLFPLINVELKAYMKKSKSNLKDDDDLIRVIEFCYRIK